MTEMTIGSAGFWVDLLFVGFGSDSYFALMICVYSVATCFCFDCFDCCYCNASPFCLSTLIGVVDLWSYRGACGVGSENHEMHFDFDFCFGGNSNSCFFFCLCYST